MPTKKQIRDYAKLLNPIDDPMFRKMAEEKEFCEEILRTILDDKDLVVVESTPQWTGTNLMGRSVILDAKCVTGDGRQINIEIQKADDDDHQRRSSFSFPFPLFTPKGHLSLLVHLVSSIPFYLIPSKIFGQNNTKYYRQIHQFPFSHTNSGNTPPHSQEIFPHLTDKLFRQSFIVRNHKGRKSKFLNHKVIVKSLPEPITPK